MSKSTATFGVWESRDGAHYSFVRWLTHTEVDERSTLEMAANWFLHFDQPPEGRYMIQRLSRGASGKDPQALTFDATALAPRLRVVPTTTS